MSHVALGNNNCKETILVSVRKSERIQVSHAAQGNNTSLCEEKETGL